MTAAEDSCHRMEQSNVLMSLFDKLLSKLLLEYRLEVLSFIPCYVGT